MKSNNSKDNKSTGDEKIRLNKYIAGSGVCSRRQADELISKGQVKVNDEVVLEMGHKVSRDDKVELNGKTLFSEKLVYILLNKPKDSITTTADTHGRRTVIDVLKYEGKERLFPVGRLDRNTTGVLLLTNDGQLSQEMTHPKYNVRKTYKATLDKSLTSTDLEKLLAGVELEDGLAKADEVAFVDPGDKRQVGVEIHSGKNRVVRRMFEAIGFEVRSLDRVLFGELSKEGIGRGKWRFLKEYEVRKLKNTAGKRKPK
jgi:23S rRNA pseudouridine2605 synthase